MANRANPAASTLGEIRDAVACARIGSGKEQLAINTAADFDTQQGDVDHGTDPKARNTAMMNATGVPSKTSSGENGSFAKAAAIPNVAMVAAVNMPLITDEAQ